jgi:DNA end-binding protein Ku
MPRAIWSGAIGFGLVNVPVRLYSAIDEQDVHFHLLHTKDDSRIGYEKFCKKEDKPVPDDEIERAYEISKGRYVYVTDEDLEAAQGKTYKRIDILDFVDYEEIDPIYFERTYFLGPGEGAEKVYVLLVRAMEDSGLAGIAKYVMRDKQQLGCLRVREGMLTLEKMYFADEIRPIDEIKVRKVTVDRKELAMAAELIDRFRSPFKISKYRDDYRQDLLKVIRAKAKGKEVKVEAVDEEPELPDLFEALRASLESARGGKGSGKRKSSSNGGGAGSRQRSRNGSFDEMSKADLVKRAKRDGVTGYSKMSKDELVRALKSAA